MMRGELRDQFYEEIEAALDAHKEVIREPLRRNNATEGFQKLMDVVQPIVQQHFSMQGSKRQESESLSEAKKVHKELLWQRANIRRRMRNDNLLGMALVSDIMQLWKAETQLKINGKDLANSKKHFYSEINKQHERELNEAWRERDLHQAWQSARSISGCQKGSKRRWGSLPQVALPFRQQNEEQLKAPPEQGGWQAEVLMSSSMDKDALVNERIQGTYGQGFPFSYFASPEDVQKVCEHTRVLVWQQASRKHTPSWDIPMEVYKLLLEPKKVFVNAEWASLRVSTVTPHESDLVLPSWRNSMARG